MFQYLRFTAFLVLFVGCTNVNSYKGYKTVKTTQVKPIGSDVVEMVHEKSGATVVLIKNKDQAKTFMAGFRTPPYDDTGLFHIFEHAVLEGSRLYPSKSNFFNVANSTVASFVNAMTGAVYTLYPFVTRSNKDFDNLMSVYLDSVFFPKVLEDPRIIKREGWRYEVNPKTKEMSINGIVLSEMKGAFSSPGRSVNYHINKAMVPQTPYSYSSGGFPAKVATLTFQQIKDAHKKYYHPQNSLILLYGDLDYKKALKTLDEQFLSHFTADPGFERPAIPLQTDFNYPKEDYVATYPGPAKADKDYLAKTYMIGKTTPIEDSAYSVLNQAFVENDAAPLRLRVLKEGIAKTVYTGSAGGEDNGLSFIFEGTSQKQKAKIDSILISEITKASQDGLDPKLLNSILNKYEFYFKEKNSNGAMRGFQLAYRSLFNWLEPKESLPETLDFVTHFKKVRAKLEDQEFVKAYFKNLLTNSKFRWVVMKPDPKFSEKFNAGLDEQVKQALKEKPVEEYMKEQEEYEKWVAAPESKEILDTIPTLELSDIKPDEPPIEFKEVKIGELNEIHYPQKTNGISYVNLFFDLKGIPAEEIKNLSLFSKFLKESDTENYGFKDLSKELDTYVGGLGIGATTYQSTKDPSQFKPMMKVSISYLDENKDKVFELLNEVITLNKFEPEDHLNNLLREFKSNMASGAVYRAPGLTYSAATSEFFPTLGTFNDQMGGAEFEKYVKNTDFNAKTLTPHFHDLKKQIFNNKRLKLVTITSTKENIPQISKKVDELVKAWASKYPADQLNGDQAWTTQSDAYDGFIIPGEVQYTAVTTQYSKHGMNYDGSMKVYDTFLKNKYMVPKLREQAGAYGAGTAFQRNGLFMAYTYKDPNLKTSYDVISEIPQFMKSQKLTKKEITPAILGALKPYYKDVSIAGKTSSMTSMLLQESTWADYMAIKKQIMETTPEKFQKITEVLEKALPGSIKTASGNKNKIKKEGKFLKKVMTIE